MNEVNKILNNLDNNYYKEKHKIMKKYNKKFKKGDRVQIKLKGSCVYDKYGTVEAVEDYIYVKVDNEFGIPSYDCTCLIKIGDKK